MQLFRQTFSIPLDNLNALPGALTLHILNRPSTAVILPRSISHSLACPNRDYCPARTVYTLCPSTFLFSFDQRTQATIVA